MKINNKEFDTLTLYVKKEKSEKIIENYKVFKWELVEEKENTQYEDIVDLTFIRQHKIENKDELQLLQVYMEERLNEQGKIEKHKHSKSCVLGLCLGLLCGALIALGLLFCFQVLPKFGLVGGIVLASFGFLLVLFELIYLPKLFKKESVFYENRSKILEQEINIICKNASALAGGEYEQK